MNVSFMFNPTPVYSCNALLKATSANCFCKRQVTPLGKHVYPLKSKGNNSALNYWHSHVNMYWLKLLRYCSFIFFHSKLDTQTCFRHISCLWLSCQQFPARKLVPLIPSIKLYGAGVCRVSVMTVTFGVTEDIWLISTCSTPSWCTR